MIVIVMVTVIAIENDGCEKEVKEFGFELIEILLELCTKGST